MANKSYYLETHETTEVPLKLINVDTRMVPVVNYLNSKKEVFTQSCCEGTNDKPAYVIFICTETHSLYETLKEIKHVFEIELNGNQIRYTLKTYNLDQFCYITLPQ